MTTLREAAQMALEAHDNGYGKIAHDAAIEALRQALAQDSLRKLAEIDRELGLFDEPIKSEHTAWITAGNHTVPLEVVPPKREWVGLTEDEFEGVLELNNEAFPFAVYQQLEAKLKEKNT